MNDELFYDYLMMLRNLCIELNVILEAEIEVQDLLDALRKSDMWIRIDHDDTAQEMYAELMMRKDKANGSK